NLFETFGIPPNTAEHAGPRFADDELAAGIAWDGVSFVVDNFGKNSEEGQGGAAGFGGDCAGQGSDHDNAGFGLPPGIDNRATLAADNLMIPDPCFGIDRFADGAEEAQRSEIVFLRPFDAPFHESADCGGRGVKNGDVIFFDDLP